MKSLINAMLAVAGLSILALVSGCVNSPVDDAEGDMNAPAMQSLGVSDGSSCYVGAWTEGRYGCDCPAAGQEGWTLECAASDCVEEDLLALNDQNEAIRVSVRMSALEGRLSAISKVDEGAWKASAGELVLAFDGGEETAATVCSDSALQPHGQDAISRADKALTASIDYAWQTGHWLDAPYQP